MKSQKLLSIAFFATATLLIAGTAYASSDTTFGTVAGGGPVGTMSGWLQGSMGRMFSIGALAVGLGIGIVKQSVMAVAVGTGIALAASAGPTVLGAIFTAAI